MTDFTDKGKERGAILRLSREIVDAGSQLHYATIDQTIFCRKDGGRGGLPPRVHDTWRPPEGEPDFSIDWPTFPSQGLLYRQNGDRNELHVRNDIARAAGFRQPLFHGLATLGIAVHGVLRSVCDYDPHRVGSVAARFTAPMYPGETVRTQIWRQGNEVRFRVFCVERDTMVLDRGIVRLR